MSAIVEVRALEILDSRGWPTVEAEVILESGARGVGRSPSGASTGRFEASEKRDGESRRYRGRGVRRAVEAAAGELADAIEGMEASDQYAVDAAMLAVDGSDDKSRLGANAILAVSLAVAQAAAADAGLPLFRYLGGAAARTMPTPMMNLLNGGRHAANALAIQEFMAAPVGAESFGEALRMGAEIFHALGALIDSRQLGGGVGDEGGYAPNLATSVEALDLLLAAVEKAGWRPGEDAALALDVAASECLQGERYRLDGRELERGALAAWYQQLLARYPIVSLEDPFAEDDLEGWRLARGQFGDRVQIVGDDLFVTSAQRIERYASFANAVLIKPNQIGSLSETLEASATASRLGLKSIVSHRSGETEDCAIADLAVATGCGQIKTGSLARSERLAKYNRLLRIEDELAAAARYGGATTLAAPWPWRAAGKDSGRTAAAGKNSGRDAVARRSAAAHSPGAPAARGAAARGASSRP